jgi:hypothetical protein
MQVRVAIPEHAVGPATLEPALEATTRVDEHLIRTGIVPLASTAIAAGVRWRPEPPGDESFDHGDIVWGRGWGDCDDLAPWHAASLRVTGEDPGARAIVIPSGPQTWHAIVQRSSGRLEDPSLAAGMPMPGASPTLPIEQPMVVGAIYVGLRPSGRGWQSRIDVPIPTIGCCCMSILEADQTPQQALVRGAHKAAVVGQLCGAAVDDVSKLQALAALASGISQRQLIDHVDPDLLLCAVLLNTTINRLIDKWHQDRGVVNGALREMLPHSFSVMGAAMDTPALRNAVKYAEAKRRAEAARVARGFQKGMAKFWASKKGKQYIAVEKAAKALHTTPEAIYQYAQQNGVTLAAAVHALKLGAGFQHGMANYWAKVRANDLKVLNNPQNANPQAVVDAVWRLLPADGDQRAVAAAHAFLVHLFTQSGGQLASMNVEPYLPELFGGQDVLSTDDANNLQDLGRRVGLATYWFNAADKALKANGLPTTTNSQWAYFSSVLTDSQTAFQAAWDAATQAARAAGMNTPGTNVADIMKVVQAAATAIMALI